MTTGQREMEHPFLALQCEYDKSDQNLEETTMIYIQGSVHGSETWSWVQQNLEWEAESLLNVILNGSDSKIVYERAVAFTERCGDYLPILNAKQQSSSDQAYLDLTAGLYRALEAKLTRHECGFARLSPQCIQREIEQWRAGAQTMVGTLEAYAAREESSSFHHSTRH